MNLSVLPTVNAVLNGTCAIFLLTGFFFIKNHQVMLHKIFMGLAFLTSILFLTSYLTYHWQHGATRFPGSGVQTQAWASERQAVTIRSAVFRRCRV